MTISTNDTVGQLAVSVPGATRIFEKLGIDYCCGGKQTLDEACRRRNLPVAELIQKLEESREFRRLSGEGQDWQTEKLSTLAGFIVETHHHFTRQEIDRLEKLLDKVSRVHGENHPELLTIRDLFQQIKQDLLPHMLKEEQVLFPYISNMEESVLTGRAVMPPFFGTVRNPVRMMMMEHDTAGDLLRAMRTESNDYALPEGACRSYMALYEALPEFEADLHQHIHLENNLLFPRAVEMEEKAAPERQNISFSEHRCFGH